MGVKLRFLQPPRQPVRQRTVQERAQRVRHHQLHESVWQLLGGLGVLPQCLQRDTVRFIESRALAREAVCDQEASQRCEDGVAALV